MLTDVWNSINNWLGSTGLKIVIVILLGWLISRYGENLVRQIVRRSITPDDHALEREERLREDTIIGIVSTTLKLIIWLVVAMIILSEFSIDIGPLIAGAGVIGFAVGFGAQSLIKDFISGLFIVAENQYRVGDVVKLNGVSGKVIKISLRTTVLRDINGNVHHIPNGSVTLSTNQTMEFSKINMNIGVSYDSDIAKVEKVINEVGTSMLNDENWHDEIIEAPHFVRIAKFDDSAVVVKILGKTHPAKQWSIAGELRRRLKFAFDEHGIEIPFKQIVVRQEKNKPTSK